MQVSHFYNVHGRSLMPESGIGVNTPIPNAD
jgi:hypothetical protein